MADSKAIFINGVDIGMSGPINHVSVYNLTVDVVRMTKVNSSEGQSETPVTLVNLMPCSIKWMRGKEKILFNKETYLLDAILSCQKPVGVTIASTDKVLYNSEYYEIVAPPLDINNLGVLLEIAIKKVK